MHRLFDKLINLQLIQNQVANCLHPKAFACNHQTSPNMHIFHYLLVLTSYQSTHGNTPQTVSVIVETMKL